VQGIFVVSLIRVSLIFGDFTSHFPDFFGDRTSHFLLFSPTFFEIGQSFPRLQSVANPNIPVLNSYSYPI